VTLFYYWWFDRYIFCECGLLSTKGDCVGNLQQIWCARNREKQKKRGSILEWRR